MAMLETLIEKNHKLEAENADLRYKLDEFRAIFEAESDPLLEFDFTPHMRRILTVLIKRKIATHEALVSALYWDRREEPSDPKNVVDNRICYLRKRLEPYGIRIESISGVGYSLKTNADEDISETINRIFKVSI